MLGIQDGKEVSLYNLWLRRQSTKFNGVSYIVQRGAEAIYSEKGRNEVKERITYYLENAKLIRKSLEDIGYFCVGGENSPYVWVKVNMNSWKFF